MVHRKTVTRHALAAAFLIPLVAVLTLTATVPAQANQDNWGSPPDVCVADNMDLYGEGVCSPAVSPQQTVKGTTSLQYMVTCQDAIANPYQNGIGPFFQSLAYQSDPSAQPLNTDYGSTVGWTTGSSVVSGEEVTTTATSGSAVYVNTPPPATVSVGVSVSAYGATPVKVYNAEVVGESTTVTFAAGCINANGMGLFGAPLSGPTSATADAVERHVNQAQSSLGTAVARTARDFATGKRTRAEYQVKTTTATGVEVHDRINLKAGKTQKTTLLCPKGMIPAGDPQTSYGFDALKDVADYRPNITATRTRAKRGITLAYTARALKYPTVAYSVLPCGKA